MESSKNVHTRGVVAATARPYPEALEHETWVYMSEALTVLKG